MKASKTTKRTKAQTDTYESDLAELLSGKQHVLIGQRTCKADGRAHSEYAAADFRWPQRGWVECSDWSPRAVCGYGLHFAAVGAVGGELVYDSGSSIVADNSDLRWQVVIALASESVRVEDNKHKARRVFVVDLNGTREAMSAWLVSHGVYGHYSTLTGGYGSTLTGGYRSTLTGGYGSTLTGGDGSTLTGGDGSTLTGGDGSTLTGGYGSTLTGGDGSTLTGGYRSTLTGGYRSTLTGGDGSTLTGGDGSTLTGGDGSTLTGGYRSKVKTGPNGVIVTTWFDDNDAQQVKAWTVGDGRELKADTWYSIVEGVATEVEE